MIDTDTSFQTTLEAARSAGLRFDDMNPPEQGLINDEEFDLHFIDWGGDNKPVIIFIHGFLQQARTWDFTCLVMRTRFRCISLDLRGHGDSGNPTNPDYTTHDYLSDLYRFVDRLKKSLGISTFSLCGLSLGGHLSYIYASERPQDVESIAVVDVAPETSRQARRGVGRFISSLPREGSFEALVERVSDLSPVRTESQVRGSLMRAVRIFPDGSWEWKHDERLLEHHRSSFSETELWRALGMVRAPALFVMGRNSKMVTSDTVRRMVELVPGSSACYVPNASHRVSGDNPIGFIRAVTPFFEHRLLSETSETEPSQ